MISKRDRSKPNIDQGTDRYVIPKKKEKCIEAELSGGRSEQVHSKVLK